MSHTPVPWRYEEFGPNLIIKAIKNPMLAVVHSLYHDSREQREADARLIAAAPEMLEALERVKATGVFLGAIPQGMVDAAIAKAKGALAEGDSKGE